MDPVHHKIPGGDDVFLYRFVVEHVPIHANFLAVYGFVTIDVPLILQGVIHHASENVLGAPVDVTLSSNDEKASDRFLGFDENVILFAVDK